MVGDLATEDVTDVDISGQIPRHTVDAGLLSYSEVNKLQFAINNLNKRST